MLRPSVLCAALVALASPSPAQDAGGLLRPVTGNVHERTVRVAPTTGRVLRMPRSIGNDGLEIVYDNICPVSYYVGLNTQTQNGAGSTGPMAVGDWGGLPATTFAGNSGCTPGCADSYEIRQFTFTYCSADGVPIDMVLHFWDRTATGGTGLHSCDGIQLIGGMVPPLYPRASWPASPTGMADLTLVGLPRNAAPWPAAQHACYAITVLLDTPGFTMTGGSTFPILSTMGDKFSWSMQVTSGIGNAGPLLAGNALFGSPCKFCAGTIWEVGGQGTNPGIGLGQSSQVWLDTYGGTTPATGNCYMSTSPWFGMLLLLYAHEPCGIEAGDFCNLGDGALASCPCGNAGDAASGCDNAQGTGGVHLDLAAQTSSPNGATLVGTGFPVMASPTAIVLRSNALDPMSPTHAFGHSAAAGTGDFYYQVWYRNTPSSFCDPLAAFNLSSGIVLTW
jgi:hypothetical protein